MYSFKNYIKTTSTLCIYQLRSEYICPSIYFPNVDTLALLRCSPSGISNIIKSSIFPNLERIHYVSLHPGDYRIHTRFSRTRMEWIFPQQSYTFYDNMVNAKLGIKTDNLISSYVDNKLTLDSTDTRPSFYIKLPGYKNNKMIDAELYRVHLMNYLIYPQGIQLQPSIEASIMAQKDTTPHSRQKVEMDFFDSMMLDNSSHK